MEIAPALEIAPATDLELAADAPNETEVPIEVEPELIAVAVIRDPYLDSIEDPLAERVPVDENQMSFF